MSKGGGVLVYVKEDIHSELVKLSARNEFTDAIAVKLHDQQNDTTLIVSVSYRNTTSDTQNDEQVLLMMQG